MLTVSAASLVSWLALVPGEQVDDSHPFPSLITSCFTFTTLELF